MKRITLFLLVNMFCLSAMAQIAEVGVFGGGSYYMGDLNPKIPFYGTKLAYGATVRYNFDQRLALRLDGKYGTLAAKNSDQNVLPHLGDTSFNTKSMTISLIGEWNYLDYFIGSNKSNVTPYLFAGLGYQHVGTVEDMKDNITLTEQENFVQRHIVIPFGMGMKMNLTKTIALNVDWTMVKSFSDAIDGLGYLNAEGKQITNVSTNDWYSYAGITLLYKIDMRPKNKCYGMGGNY